jgi:hypothetical protein
MTLGESGEGERRAEKTERKEKVYKKINQTM